MLAKGRKMNFPLVFHPGTTPCTPTDRPHLLLTGRGRSNVDSRTPLHQTANHLTPNFRLWPHRRKAASDKQYRQVSVFFFFSSSFFAHARTGSTEICLIASCLLCRFLPHLVVMLFSTDKLIVGGWAGFWQDGGARARCRVPS